MMKIKNIKLKEKQNIRDFSYIINKDNYTILNNSFLRSNNINVFDREDIEFLKDNYHLKTIIDLRNKDEVLLNPCNIDNIKYYNIPLFESRKRKSTSSSSNKQKVSKVPNIYEVYLDMIRTKTAKKQLKKIIKKDYLYSNNYLESIANDKYNYYLEKSRNKEYALQMRDIFLVKEEYIDYIIDYMINKKGSVINFIKKELGVSERRIIKFKNNVLHKIDK